MYTDNIFLTSFVFFFFFNELFLTGDQYSWHCLVVWRLFLLSNNQSALWASFFVSWQSTCPLSIFVGLQQSPCPLSIFALRQPPCVLIIFSLQHLLHSLSSFCFPIAVVDYTFFLFSSCYILWPLLTSLTHDTYVLTWGGVLRIWFEKMKHNEYRLSLWQRESHVEEISISFVIIYFVSFSNNLSFILLSLSRSLVLMTFVTSLSHMIHMLQLEGSVRDIIWLH